MKDKIFNIIFDNWRGYRFIYDTRCVRNCNNDCKNCPLFKALNGYGLFEASKKDKKLFGPNNFLNCKTLKQYEDCYVNFLVNECCSEKEVIDELNLLKNMRIIYAHGKNCDETERKFKKNVIKRVNRVSPKWKKSIICLKNLI